MGFAGVFEKKTKKKKLKVGYVYIDWKKGAGEPFLLKILFSLESFLDSVKKMLCWESEQNRAENVLVYICK